jgi:hypothetical protein
VVPTISLNDGARIPQLGFGTLSVPPGRDSTPERMAQTAEIVGIALELGYRHIDTAQQYGNERGVGDAIAAAGIPREELWVTSKLGNRNHPPDDVRRSFEETLEKLGLDYLDLFLIHWRQSTHRLNSLRGRYGLHGGSSCLERRFRTRYGRCATGRGGRTATSSSTSYGTTSVRPPRPLPPSPPEPAARASRGTAAGRMAPFWRPRLRPQKWLDKGRQADQGGGTVALGPTRRFPQRHKSPPAKLLHTTATRGNTPGPCTGTEGLQHLGSLENRRNVGTSSKFLFCPLYPR